jgi:hypothetical protein
VTENRAVSSEASVLKDVIAGVRERGFARAAADEMGSILGDRALQEWSAFAASWDHLGVDAYMADGGRYRRRRFAAFALRADGSFARKPHQPHYQSRDYNPLNGGIQRWFDPITDDVAAHPVLAASLGACTTIFGPLRPAEAQPLAWHAEVHQFRVEARLHEAGRPTPEGVHQDGVDWVLVMLIRRQNVQSGKTEIFNAAGESLGSFTLESPMESVFVDDSRVFHGVTPITPLDPVQPAFRDVLVVTLRRP